MRWVVIPGTCTNINARFGNLGFGVNAGIDLGFNVGVSGGLGGGLGGGQGAASPGQSNVQCKKQYISKPR